MHIGSMVLSIETNWYYRVRTDSYESAKIWREDFDSVRSLLRRTAANQKNSSESNDPVI